MTQNDPDSIIIIACGGARPQDTHLASRIVAVDGEIIEWLRRRERRRQRRRDKCKHCHLESCYPTFLSACQVSGLLNLNSQL